MPQAQLLQPHPQSRSADADPGLVDQPLLHLGQGQIRLLPQGGPQLLLDHRRQAAGRAMPALPRPLLLPRLQLLGTNFLAVPPTDAELLGQLLQAPSPAA